MRGGKNRRAGFTIVELLLATAIFSTVLMVVIAGFLQIGKLFYKGITLTNTQQVGRQIVDNITNDIRYSSIVSENNHSPLSEASPINSNDSQNYIGYYCVGNVRYTYHLHNLVTGPAPTDFTAGNSNFGLLRDTLPGATGCDNPYSGTPFNNPKELLSVNTRLNDLDISTLTGGQVYNISVDIVAGDDSSVQTSDADPPGFVRCESNLKSSQYCAEAKLSSSVSVNTGALSVSNVRKNGIIVKKGGKGHGIVISSVDSANYHGKPPTPTDQLLCGDTCQVVYPDITPVILNVQTPFLDQYSQFDKWTFSKSDQGCDATKSWVVDKKNPNRTAKCEINVIGGIYATAVFKCVNPSKSCDYTLKVNKTGDGTGSVDCKDDSHAGDQAVLADCRSTDPEKLLFDCGTNCSHTFDYVIQKITLTARPNSNSSFSKWSGKNVKCQEGNSSKLCTIKVDQVKNVQAQFKCNVSACSWDITVSLGGNGGGVVQSTPDPGTNVRKIDCGDICSASFPQATTISLTAIPDDKSVFSSWNNSCKNGDNHTNPCTVNVDDSINWKATFKPK